MMTAVRGPALITTRGPLAAPSSSPPTFQDRPHRCIGIHFASLQMEVAFAELLSRATNFRIPPGKQVEMSTGVVFGPERLPLEFDVR